MNEISTPSIYRLDIENPNLPSGIFRYGNILTVKNAANDTAWQLIGSYSSDALWFRRGTWYADGTGTMRTNAWKEIAFTDSNVASASKLGTSTVGSASLPIYLNNGTATACTGSSLFSNLSNSMSASINLLIFTPFLTKPS